MTNTKRLNNYHYSVIAREGINKYVIKIDEIQNGIHIIEVNTIFEGKKNRVLLCKFVLDSKLAVECEKMGNDAYIVTIASSLFSAPIIQEIHPDTFSDKWLSCFIDGITYIFDIPFDFEFYQIGDGKWKSISEELWIEDISQDTILTVYGDIDTLQVISSEGNVLEESIQLSDNGIYQQVRIGFLVSYKSTYKYSILLLLKDGKVKEGLYCYNQCILDEDRTEFIYDSVMRCLEIMPQYWGKGKVFLRIFSDEKEIYKSNFLESGVVELISGLDSFINYKIIFYEKEKRLGLKKERCMGEYEKIFYAHEDFVGRSFRIREVVYDQLVRGKFLRKKYYFPKTYVYFIDMVSQYHFSGEIYARTYKGTYMLNKVNPVDIEICSDVIDGSVELAITNHEDGDGLLLDFEHHGIKNTMHDNSAIDIFSYIIDMNGEKTF